ncbi:MAG TPA: cob(I)yrinic acid a,c-diamide adenosyltransferase [Acidimicrobiales bacterium]|nr:cob(I)yrinic acid a,c-diamide adenosyltransferase [Acidimicrobiales bacterium]
MPPPSTRQPRIYTRHGDDGTTGLLYGGRAPKGSPRIELNGAVDEAQAALGVARAESDPDAELDRLLVSLERDLYVLMAEVATLPEHRDKLVAGTTLVTGDMVAALEARIDDLLGRFDMPSDFVIPGHDRCSAALDLARTVVRRAERLVGTVPDLAGDSLVGPYLNRLSDLVWAMARWQEGEEHLVARGSRRRGRPAGAGPTGGADGSAAESGADGAAAESGPDGAAAESDSTGTGGDAG